MDSFRSFVWVTVWQAEEGSVKWLVDIFNPPRPETQIVLKKLIMSCLVWLMIKDNYFFISLAKAECFPSDVAT